MPAFAIRRVTASPAALSRADLPPGPNDLKLGEIGGSPFYVDEDQYRRWRSPVFAIDVATGEAGGFSLEGAEGVHFVSSSAGEDARSRWDIDSGPNPRSCTQPPDPGDSMNLGYDHKLYILAFDHRGSFTKRFGIEGDPAPEEMERLTAGKHLIFEGIEAALERGADPSVTGALVDEQFGGPSKVPEEAKAKGIKLAMPVEKSGQKEFDFEYGEDFGAHIERYDPDFSKVLVRSNPDGDAEMNKRQAERLRRLSEWLHENERKFLFELLVPAEEEQLASVAGDADRYDAELRPELMRRAIADFQEAGVEADIWKIEGVDARADCERIADQCRSGGRDGVVCVVLGRGADDAKVDHWLREAAPVDAYVGFAIGRSIWGEPLAGFIDGSLSREQAAGQLADNYQRFIDVYTSAEAETG